MDLFRRAQGGEDVDEAEQLCAEGAVLHGPRHELIGPETAREDALAMLAHGSQQPPADFDGPPLKRVVRRRRLGAGGHCLIASEPCHRKFPCAGLDACLCPTELYGLAPCRHALPARRLQEEFSRASLFIVPLSGGMHGPRAGLGNYVQSGGVVPADTTLQDRDHVAA